MVNKEEIAGYFQDLNLTINDAVINKCLELCAAYTIEGEDFFDQWCAFTASNLNGAPPTIEFLEKMERKEFNKVKDANFLKSGIPKLNEEIQEERNPTEQAELTPQPKLQIQNEAKTSSEREFSINISNNTTPVSLIKLEKKTQRNDIRSVQNFYGPATATFKRKSTVISSIKEIEDHKISPNIRYMYEIMGKKARSMNSVINNLGHAILKKHGLNVSDGILINQIGEMVTYGRIMADSDGRINSQSILLEGTDETNLNYSTRLNLSKLASYSLFPGQIIAAKGNNVKNMAFVAEKIYTDAYLELPEEPPVQNGAVQIIIAAGPFTFRENLSYEPLKDLLKYVIEHEPHILILMGPFLEKTHECILLGTLAQTFDSFFEELIENIMKSLQHLEIQVVIVSSQKEAHHHPVYPTPSYHLREKYNKLLFVADPGVIEIEGLVIGTTTADILLHMSNYELHYDQSATKSSRMERIISHLINQRQFYPLYPPHKELNVDHVLLKKFGILENKPHILILPSSLKNFVKDVGECLVINPEKLTKGFEAGTFAQIQIESGSSRSICSRAAVQVLRL